MNKKKKDIKEKNINNKAVKREIPDNIKLLYGKFYVFSFIYIFIFLVIYPFILINRIKEWASIAIFIILGCFYIYMIWDVLKHKGQFNSTMFMILILLVIMALSFSIVKFVL